MVSKLNTGLPVLLENANNRKINCYLVKKKKKIIWNPNCQTRTKRGVRCRIVRSNDRLYFLNCNSSGGMMNKFYDTLWKDKQDEQDRETPTEQKALPKEESYTNLNSESIKV